MNFIINLNILIYILIIYEKIIITFLIEYQNHSNFQILLIYLFNF